MFIEDIKIKDLAYDRDHVYRSTLDLSKKLEFKGQYLNIMMTSQINKLDMWIKITYKFLYIEQNTNVTINSYHQFIE